MITDNKTIKIVVTMEDFKKKGLVVTARDKIRDKIFKTSLPVANVVSESTIVVLSIISAVALVSLYALYKNKNIKVKYNPDGSVELDTSN